MDGVLPSPHHLNIIHVSCNEMMCHNFYHDEFFEESQKANNCKTTLPWLDYLYNV